MRPSSEDETPERQGRGGLGVNSHGKIIAMGEKSIPSICGNSMESFFNSDATKDTLASQLHFI